MKAPRIRNMSRWKKTINRLKPDSMRLFDEITEMLETVKPMENYNNKYMEIWVSEERGTIADMGFHDLEDAMYTFEVDNEEDLNKAFLEEYPEEKSWFLLEFMYNEEVRLLRLRRFDICIYNEASGRNIPDNIDQNEYDYSEYLQWVKDALTKSLKQAEDGLYSEILEKELPYDLRYGTIGRKELYRLRPSHRKFRLNNLTDDEIEEFIRIIEEEGEDHIPEGRIRDMTFDIYFDYAAKAFAAAGFDCEGMTPSELFRCYGEDFGGNLLWEIPHDTPEGFLLYYNDEHRMGGHPWGLLRGSSRTRVYLRPCLEGEGFYFQFNGNEIYMAFEMIKMYMTLKKCGMPVTYSGNKERLIGYLRQEDTVGIVPSYRLPVYCQSEFPGLNVEEFMHFDPEEDGDMTDAIKWRPITPVVLKSKG